MNIIENLNFFESAVEFFWSVERSTHIIIMEKMTVIKMRNINI